MFCNNYGEELETWLSNINTFFSSVRIKVNSHEYMAILTCLV